MFWVKNLVLIAIAGVFLASACPAEAGGIAGKRQDKETPAAAPRETRKIAAREIEKNAQNYLAEHLPWEPERVEIQVGYDGEDIELPAGKIQYEYSLPQNLSRAGRIPVALKVQGEGVAPRLLRLTAFVNVYQDVVKLRKAVRRGAVLRAEDLELEQIKTDRPVSGVITRIQDAAGLEVTRNLDNGKTLTLDLLRKPFVINRGDHVLIIAVKGDMKITASGIAKDSGVEGNTIPVENVQTKKVVYGQVVDQNSVKINF
ncbi:MAG: flagellar basal body P-ring formation protein FlgA [Nitrospinae bacterium]|nr:flagellar basal body P-ring formation protein FlgA [Nitrospinota bacterium]